MQEPREHQGGFAASGGAGHGEQRHLAEVSRQLLDLLLPAKESVGFSGLECAQSRKWISRDELLDRGHVAIGFAPKNTRRSGSLRPSPTWIVHAFALRNDVFSGVCGAAA